MQLKITARFRNHASYKLGAKYLLIMLNKFPRRNVRKHYSESIPNSSANDYCSMLIK